MTSYWNAERAQGGNPILRLSILIAVSLVVLGVALVPTILNAYALTVNFGVPMTPTLIWDHVFPSLLIASIIILVLVGGYFLESRSMRRRFLRENEE